MKAVQLFFLAKISKKITTAITTIRKLETLSSHINIVSK